MVPSNCRVCSTATLSINGQRAVLGWARTSITYVDSNSTLHSPCEQHVLPAVLLQCCDALCCIMLHDALCCAVLCACCGCQHCSLLLSWYQNHITYSLCFISCHTTDVCVHKQTRIAVYLCITTVQAQIKSVVACVQVVSRCQITPYQWQVCCYGRICNHSSWVQGSGGRTQHTATQSPSL